MTTLEELGAFLEAEGVGVLGTSLFLAQLPAAHPSGPAPATCMALVQTPGRAPEHHLTGTGAIAIEFPRFQFLSRAASRVTAQANAELAYRVLAPVANRVLSGTFYSNISISQSPGMLYMDPSGALSIVGFNFECEKALS